MVLPSWAYLLIAIIVLLLLLVTFVVTFVIYQKTPTPKGCEDLIENEKCSSCNNVQCAIKKSHKKEDN